jgi:hypothetical protein
MAKWFGIPSCGASWVPSPVSLLVWASWVGVVIVSGATRHQRCQLAHLRPAGHHSMLAYLLTHVTPCGMAGDSALQRGPREGQPAGMATYSRAADMSVAHEILPSFLLSWVTVASGALLEAQVSR